MRDWSHGQALGYYSIQPSQFNTRMPLHIDDDDLCPMTLKVNVHGHITERPRSDFTMLSYTVHALEIAGFARESIDLRGHSRHAQGQEDTNGGIKMRNHLNKSMKSLLLDCLLTLIWEAPWDSLPQVLWQRYQCSDGCCISSFGACS